MKIINNFIDQNSFEKLQDLMIEDDTNFPWYYANYKNFKGDGIPQFTHTFFTPHSYCSNYHTWIHPILDKLKTTALIRIKANLTMKTPKPHTCHFHVDVAEVYVM